MSNFSKKKILHRKKTNRNKHRQTGSGGKASRISPTTSSTPPTPSPPTPSPTPPPASDATIADLEETVQKTFAGLNYLISLRPTTDETKESRKVRINIGLGSLFKISKMGVFQNDKKKRLALLRQIKDKKKEFDDTETSV
jgi:hypothetical protein